MSFAAFPRRTGMMTDQFHAVSVSAAATTTTAAATRVAGSADERPAPNIAEAPENGGGSRNGWAQQQQQQRTPADREMLPALSSCVNPTNTNARAEWHNDLPPREDFCTDPIRKMRRDGHFPWKLTVNCFMLLFFLLLTTLYETPEAKGGEQQRKAVLHHFLGKDYLGKDKGDIILRPTVFMHSRKDVLKGIRDFVAMYYALSDTSVSELKYFYYSHSGDGPGVLRRVVGDEISQERVNNLHTFLNEDMSNSGSENSGLNLDWVEPVQMEVDAYLYSQIEHRGPSPKRHMSFMLTEKDPLGPFANDERNEHNDDDLCNNADTNTRVRCLSRRGKRSGDGVTYQYVKGACTPRYDDITGHYYNPCRTSSKDFDDNDTEEGAIFPLMDNVQFIRLRAFVRHLTDAMANSHETSSGFSTLIYHWTIEKRFKFHPGGLVEMSLDVSVTTRRLDPYFHPRFFLAGALMLLALLDMVLRYRALVRIAAYRLQISEAQSPTQEEEPLCTLGVTNHGEVNGNSGSSGSLGSPQVSSNSTNSRDTLTWQSTGLLQRMRRSRPPKKQASQVRYAATFMTETTYTDFYDTWRQQLQQSRGEGWHYIALAGDVLTVAYASMSFVPLRELSLTEAYEVSENILLGLAGLVLSVNLLSYLRYFPQVYFMVRATRHVVPKLLQFVMSMLPIFFGFAFFYHIVFGPHSNGEFTDMGFTFVALYFMMFGDAILPAIENAENSAFVIVTILANFMTMLFILLFMMTMLNVAMSITQNEWGILRRRFGACLSVGNVLFAVRTREQVKTEALETIIANLELLLHIRHEEQLNATAAPVEGVANNDAGNAGGRDRGGGDNVSERRHQNVAELYMRRLDELTEGVLDEEG
ncbi:hypothetical protein DQ04_02301040 [Trypanosoma grayi]|uniref:hypothetical protein n=1 Tax=Trypanosoma grayi TaxID=71804 RepID=UPI0004F4A218|nr:hypothetical protein DQ04_02301040 [Trypanosoma grayi]KEG11765.1 hypothetical protein DQ04_02301040 [Trypanosoma grayi]